MKQSELAAFLNVTQSALSFWENEKYDIDNKSLLKIADYFNVSTDYVLGKDNTQIPKISTKLYKYNRIKKLRREYDMTQDDLAQLIHTQHSAISKYERGAVPLSDSLILELADIFDVSTDYLLGNSDLRIHDRNKPHRNIEIETEGKTIQYDDLPEDAQKELESYLQYLRQKHNIKE